MAKRRTTTTARRSGGTLTELRKQANAAFKLVQRAGRRQLAAIERQIQKLNRQRQSLMDELAATVGGRGRGSTRAVWSQRRQAKQRTRVRAKRRRSSTTTVSGMHLRRNKRTSW